jgi:hypothetical protein
MIDRFLQKIVNPTDSKNKIYHIGLFLKWTRAMRFHIYIV